MAAEAEHEHEAKAKRSMKCTRDIRLFPPSDYRLPDDGRQWLHVCERRKTLFLLLSSYANGDGSHINVAIGTLAEAQGWSYRTVCRLLDDFRALGILNDGDLDPRYKNTRVRSIDMEALRRLHESAQIDPAGVPSSPSGVTSSISGVTSSQNYPPKMAHNRLQTEDLTENPTEDRKQGCTGVQALSVSTSSGKSKSKPVRSSRGPIPTESWDAILRHIQGPDFAEVEWRPIRRDRAALRSLWALAPEVEAICDALDVAVSHGATCAETLFSIATQLLERDYCGTRSQRAGTA
jgi:hypothetical protein